MKKLLLVMMGIYSLAFAQNDSSGFRGFKWGTEMNIIQKQDRELTKLDKKSLIKSGTIANLPCSIIYGFEGNRLANGTYFFHISHVNSNLYIDDFKNLKQLLIKKYGQPTEDSLDWKSDTFKDEKEDNLGTAIASGNVKFVTSWNLKEHSISLELSGDNFKTNIMIVYFFNHFWELEKSNTDNQTDGL